MAGLVVWTWANTAVQAPELDRVRFINTLTMISMGLTFACVVASEWQWRALLRRPGPLAGKLQAAYIVRLAAREGAGLLGLTTAYLAAANGTLRAYPAYWVNLVPYALFLGFLAAHWPTASRLAEEAGEVLGPKPVSPQ
ncbi:MAG: hypothetical protein M0D55_04790 [Elusimicrobiota bacterium]|nr:MAG: hypothetical protein M0D55_04790 [Elusimicrobiota bacterium]